MSPLPFSMSRVWAAGGLSGGGLCPCVGGVLVAGGGAVSALSGACPFGCGLGSSFWLAGRVFWVVGVGCVVGLGVAVWWWRLPCLGEVAVFCVGVFVLVTGLVGKSFAVCVDMVGAGCSY